MTCQNCGVEIRRDGRFCYACGASLEIVDISKGKSYMRVVFTLIVNLTVFQSCFFFNYLAVAFYKFNPFPILDAFIISALFVFYLLTYNGKERAVIPTGVLIIISGLVNLALGILSIDWFLFARIILGILYIGFGFSFIKSKDVLAFVKYKATNAG